MRGCYAALASTKNDIVGICDFDRAHGDVCRRRSRRDKMGLGRLRPVIAPPARILSGSDIECANEKAPVLTSQLALRGACSMRGELSAVY